jgi:phosphoglycolate phosphatase
MPKHLIFDFDGTLADTLPLVMEVNAGIARIARPTEQELRQLRRLPLLRAVMHMPVPRWHMLRMMLMTRPLMYARMKEVSLFPGVREMIKALHAEGHTLMIVSSNHARNVHLFLQTHGLERYFSHVKHCSVFYKALALRRMIDSLQLEKADCYYIGNEPLDVRAAKKVGIHAVAVCWSGADKKVLQAEAPDTLLDNPKELLPAITPGKV